MSDAIYSKLKEVVMNLTRIKTLGGYFKLEEKPEVGTLAVKGDFTIFYNPAFIEKTSDADLDFIIQHEMLHEILDHPKLSYKIRDDEGKAFDQQTYLVACDMVINTMLSYGSKNLIPRGAVNPKDFGLDDGFIYNRCDTVKAYQTLKQQKQNLEQQEKNQGRSGPQTVEQQKNESRLGKIRKAEKNASNSPDKQSHGGDPVPEQGASDDQQESQINNEVKKQIGGGFSPFADGSLERAILTRMKMNVGPVSRALKKFSDAVRHSGAIDRRFSFREDTRYGTFPGVQTVNRSGIVIAVDVSSSVDMEKVKRFYNRAEMMISQFGEAHVIEFNSSVVKVYKVKSKFKDISHPSGGTNFDTVVDYIARKKVKCNSLVVFTDGEFEIRTDKPKYDILFCLEPKDTMHDWKYGKIIRMPL